MTATRAVPTSANSLFMKTKVSQRKNHRLKGFDYSLPFAYFVTICAKDKREIFRNDTLNIEIINCLKEERDKTGVKIFAYCLMPDHLHLLISPLDSMMNVSNFIGSFKSKTTKIGWKFEIGDKMWQGRFYDHIVRRSESLKKICEYMLNNPVRKKLVENWEDYKFGGLLDPVPI
jgi:putative transposase